MTIVDSASDIARLTRIHNALPGTHALPHSCPATLKRTEYRLTFVSATRELTASYSGSYDSAWQVSLDGRPLDPAIEDAGQLAGIVTHIAK